MKVSQGGIAMEVVASYSDRPYPEYNTFEEASSECSCFIGVARDHKLQFHLHREGDWHSGILVDVIIDGALRRTWKDNALEESHIKYLDQVRLTVRLQNVN